MEGILIWLIVGGVAGWLAGLIVKGGGQGIVINIVVGIVGAVIGGWLFGQLGVAIGTGIINSIITAVIGAVILLLIIGVIRKRAESRSGAFPHAAPATSSSGAFVCTAHARRLHSRTSCPVGKPPEPLHRIERLMLGLAGASP